jgi:hypothetical protein
MIVEVKDVRFGIERRHVRRHVRTLSKKIKL